MDEKAGEKHPVQAVSKDSKNARDKATCDASWSATFNDFMSRHWRYMPDEGDHMFLAYHKKMSESEDRKGEK